MTRSGAAAVLALRFAWQVVASGMATLRIILAPSAAAKPGFIRLRFHPMSETGASLLGCLITLTPGTTTVDIDMDERTLSLHMLDVRSADEAVATIRGEFERYIVVLFGRPS